NGITPGLLITCDNRVTFSLKSLDLSKEIAKAIVIIVADYDNSCLLMDKFAGSIRKRQFEIVTMLLPNQSEKIFLLE
ncbi:hypothetical protein GQX74_013702, partial [Glossina fuscipes]